MAVPKNTSGPTIHWLAYFWPGLPQLWVRGSWVGLAVAVGFTALANVLMLSTLVFRDWLPGKVMFGGYCMLAVVWSMARWHSRGERVALRQAEQANAGLEADEESVDPLPVERDLLFREAQGHYLANDWVATEQVLLKLLKRDARDVESRLMLATLWRHQGRSAEALRQLDRLSRLEAASEWQHEIVAERAAIEGLRDEDKHQVEEDLAIDEAPVEPVDEITEDTDNSDAELGLGYPSKDDLGSDQRRAA